MAVFSHRVLSFWTLLFLLSRFLFLKIFICYCCLCVDEQAHALAQMRNQMAALLGLFSLSRVPGIQIRCQAFEESGFTHRASPSSAFY